MPHHEGLALLKWSETFSKYGPIIEIGTYCGKSSAYLSYGAIKNNQVVYTIDHHSGSEEHQINEEYFDEEVYDESNKRIDTFPIFKMNMEKLGILFIVIGVILVNKFKDKSIADVLDMTVDEGCDFFENIQSIRSKLITLKHVGLGYIKIGQQATTLSGGEAQRIKLAKELSKRSTGVITSRSDLHPHNFFVSCC